MPAHRGQLRRRQGRQHAAGAAAAALALALCSAAAWVRPAAGHAVMIDPASRPWYDYLEHYNYNPHAVFAGGERPRRAPGAPRQRRAHAAAGGRSAR
jgi:hypothetical protein